MKQLYSNVTIAGKFFALIVLLCLLIVLNTFVHLSGEKSVDRFDLLRHHLSSIKSNIVEFELFFDIVVVSGSFEQDKKSDFYKSIKKIDSEVESLADNSYDRVFSIPALKKLRGTFFDSWSGTKGITSKLNSKSSEEAALLIHSEVDNQAMHVIELLSTFISRVELERELVFKRDQDTTLFVLIASLLLIVIFSIIFYLKEILPLMKIFLLLKGAAIDDPTKRPSEGFLSKTLSTETARILIEKMARLRSLISEKEEVISTAYEDTTQKVGVLGDVARTVGMSLSHYEVFMTAISGVFNATEAFASAVYLAHENSLKLQVSKGFSSSFFSDGEDVSMEGLLNDSSVTKKTQVFDDINDYPCKGFKALLIKERVGALIAIPIIHGDSVKGFFMVAFKEQSSFSERDVEFLSVVASFMGVGVGYAKVFYEEHLIKRFLERTFDQAPFGLCVFDADGHCTLANKAASQMLSGSDDSDLVGNYNLFKDDVLDSSGALVMVKTGFEGKATEFEVEYGVLNPGRGGVRSLSVKSFPIFDSSGNVPNIGLIYKKNMERN